MDCDAIDAVVGRLLSRRLGHPVRVGIDGPCGAGKSTLAASLAERVAARGRPAIHVDSDGFHNVRAIRYAQGRHSARGYYEGAYNLAALREQVLEPLGPGGSLTYAEAIHDLATDEIIGGATAVAPADAVVLFGCTFIFRRDLAPLWDELIWLDVPRDTAVQRAARRDAAALGGYDAALASQEDRYAAAFDLYLAAEDPRSRASIVLDYADPQHARVVPWPTDLVGGPRL